jgi:hypothetical protein
MFASSSIGVRPDRTAAASGTVRLSGPTRRVVVILFTVFVEATLVVGLILLTLAPSADSGGGTGPDRPPVPLVGSPWP